MSDSNPILASKLPLYGVAAVFALAVMCVGVTISLLPNWQAQQAERKRPMFATNDYKFTRTAVILPGERNARLREEKREVIITPASENYVPEVDMPPLTKPALQQSRSVPFIEKKKFQTPQKTDKNTPRWVTNAHLVTVPEGHKKIAIIIDDMGVAAENSQAVIDTLPKEVTLAFLPYGEATTAQAKQAFEVGHDIMIHLPMQPHRKTANPGPNALYVEDDTSRIKRNIEKNFKSLKHLSVGVNNHMGSKFTESLSGMRTVLEAVHDERMFFLDSVTTGSSAVTTASTGLSLPILKRHIFLDHEVTPEFINNALEKAERHAEKHDVAILIGHPYPETTAAIASWAPTLAEKGISLIPISNLLQTP